MESQTTDIVSALISKELALSHDERYSKLFPYEAAWRDKQQFLEFHGYMLRPRFRPGWTPSWRISGERPLRCEDSFSLPPFVKIVDAVRMSDGKLVSIKRVVTGGLETRIAMHLCSSPLDEDPMNHCVPILDIFEDDQISSVSYMVMPFLRYTDSPPFDCVDDILDIGEQLLEGLVFLHKNGVAHRDCSYANLMMDANPLYPQGFHPIMNTFLPDCKTIAWPNSRTHYPVKYYFIDFDISVYFPPDAQHKLVTGRDGRDQEPPELSDDVPYDPFKLDIFIIGNVFRKEFYNKFSNVGFLQPMFDAMTQADPNRRPSAAEALQQWKHMRRTVPYVHRRWRLRKRKDSTKKVVILDIVHLVTSGFHLVTRRKTTKNVFHS